MQLGATMDEGASPSGAPERVFSYDEASDEEREAWLNAAAAKLEKHGKREAGSSPFVSYKETNVRVRSREIQTVLKLGHYVDFRMDSKTIQDTLSQACPRYIRDGLYANNIKWTQRLVKQDGSVAMNLPISRSNCRRFLPKT